MNMNINTNQSGQRADAQEEAAMPCMAPPSEDDEYYILGGEGENGEDNGGLLSMQNAAPFQISGALPAFESGKTTTIADQPLFTTSSPQPQRKRPLILFIALTAVAVALGFTLLLSVLAISATPQKSKSSPTTISTVGQPQPTQKPTQIAANPTQTTTGNWIHQQLPNGWTTAGLTTSDAIFAERTAVTFTDREEGLDYRNVGTRTNHGGTMTAAVFLLTRAGQARFQENDVRAINNMLFDRIEQEQLVQAAVNLTPTVSRFQTVGQQQFAWVRVSFYLWQSQNNPQHTEGLDTDPITHQPRIHQMTVLLLRVPYTNQGNNPAMGGTGWLVSTYTLDSGLPTLIQPA